jgi:hypothetical protein
MTRAAAVQALAARLEELRGLYADIARVELVDAAEARACRARVDRLWARDSATLAAWVAWRGTTGN